MELTNKQIEIIRFIQGDLPCVENPYADLAKKIEMTEQQVVDAIREMLDVGVIRRFGMAVRHQNIGYKANGMSCWNIPADKVDAAAEVMKALPEITHCYERPRFDDWRFNVYAMIHGREHETVINIAKELSEKIGVEDYDVLFSTKEYKRTSMTYFVEED
jgi:DNA-binding Lrp family transcriptional regulator